MVDGGGTGLGLDHDHRAERCRRVAHPPVGDGDVDRRSQGLRCCSAPRFAPLESNEINGFARWSASNFCA